VAVSTGNVAGAGTLSTSPSVSIGFLNGDANFDGVVNVGDTIVTRSHAGQPVDGTNFQFDVNADGQIDIGDATIVRSKSGDYLP
ncbi:MAG TPA: dockerin type I domain-containing protein, partial [Bryobacteraceae bacterium]